MQNEINEVAVSEVGDIGLIADEGLTEAQRMMMPQIDDNSERDAFCAALRGEMPVPEVMLAAMDAPATDADIARYTAMIERFHETDDKYDFETLLGELDGDVSGIADSIRCHVKYLQRGSRAEVWSWAFSAARKGHPNSASYALRLWVGQEAFPDPGEGMTLLGLASYVGGLYRAQGCIGPKFRADVERWHQDRKIDKRTCQYLLGFGNRKPSYSGRLRIGAALFDGYRIGFRRFDALRRAVQFVVDNRDRETMKPVIAEFDGCEVSITAKGDAFFDFNSYMSLELHVPASQVRNLFVQSGVLPSEMLLMAVEVVDIQGRAMFGVKPAKATEQ